MDSFYRYVYVLSRSPKTLGSLYFRRVEEFPGALSFHFFSGVKPSLSILPCYPLTRVVGTKMSNRTP
jgi:hypothetical protein